MKIFFLIMIIFFWLPLVSAQESETSELPKLSVFVTVEKPLAHISQSLLGTIMAHLSRDSSFQMTPIKKIIQDIPPASLQVYQCVSKPDCLSLYIDALQSDAVLSVAVNIDDSVSKKKIFRPKKSVLNVRYYLISKEPQMFETAEGEKGIFEKIQVSVASPALALVEKWKNKKEQIKEQTMNTINDTPTETTGSADEQTPPLPDETPEPKTWMDQTLDFEEKVTSKNGENSQNNNFPESEYTQSSTSSENPYRLWKAYEPKYLKKQNSYRLAIFFAGQHVPEKQLLHFAKDTEEMILKEKKIKGKIQVVELQQIQQIIPIFSDGKIDWCLPQFECMLSIAQKLNADLVIAGKWIPLKKDLNTEKKSTHPQNFSLKLYWLHQNFNTIKSLELPPHPLKIPDPILNKPLIQLIQQWIHDIDTIPGTESFDPIYEE